MFDFWDNNLTEEENNKNNKKNLHNTNTLRFIKEVVFVTTGVVTLAVSAITLGQKIKEASD